MRKLKACRATGIIASMVGNYTIALIGAGNMTEALVAGMLQAGVTSGAHLLATDILPERLATLQRQYGIQVSSDNVKAGEMCQIIILSVEPQVLGEVLDEMAPAIRPESLVISVVAGYPIERVAGHLRGKSRIIRAMPNTPSSVQVGITALSYGAGIRNEDASLARTIFQSVGKVVDVEERLMDAVTGLSGSGPAYIYLMIEALADGGVKMGLPRQAADLLAAQTVLGAARLVVESNEHPARLKDRVASPGGTTIAGLHELEKGGFRAALTAAVQAATERSKELGSEP